MKINTLSFIFLFGLTLVAISSCGKDEVDQALVDQMRIDTYIADHHLVMDSTASGLYYYIEIPGTGGHPTQQDAVEIAYTGKLIDDTIFDSSTSTTFYLNTLIPGWREGIPLFGRGGKGILILPSRLGYGSYAFSNIPANSVLVFDIELIDF